MDAAKGDHIKPQKQLMELPITKKEFLCVKPEQYKPRYLQKPRRVKKIDPTPPGQKKKVSVKPFNNLSEVVEDLKDQGH